MSRRKYSLFFFLQFDWSPNGFAGAVAAVEQRQRVAGAPAQVAAGGRKHGLEVLEAAILNPGRRDEAEEVLEEGLIDAGEGDRASEAGGEAVFLLGPEEELPEDRVVKVGRAHHEAPRAASHAQRHVPRRDVRRRRRRRAPPPQNLPEANYAADPVAFSHPSISLPDRLAEEGEAQLGREQSSWPVASYNKAIKGSAQVNRSLLFYFSFFEKKILRNIKNKIIFFKK